MSATLQLAKFIAATPPEEIPDDVLHHGKRCMINMLAVALHATQNPALGIFLDLFEDEGGRKQASVLGVGVKTTLQNATMANGFLAHLDDFDDTFLPTVFHPSAPTIPPAGPDRIASLPWNRWASVSPPLDCMNWRRMPVSERPPVNSRSTSPT